jgi:hypothetical protein
MLSLMATKGLVMVWEDVFKNNTIENQLKDIRKSLSENKVLQNDSSVWVDLQQCEVLLREVEKTYHSLNTLSTPEDVENRKYLLLGLEVIAAVFFAISSYIILFQSENPNLPNNTEMIGSIVVGFSVILAIGAEIARQQTKLPNDKIEPLVNKANQLVNEVYELQRRVDTTTT